MTKKIERSISWLTIMAICFVIVFGVGVVLKEIVADSVQPSVNVGNIAPSVGAVTLNASADLTIIGNSTHTIVGTTTITDSNGWDDITSVTSTLFNNNTTSCNTASNNALWCYGESWITCATTSCDGSSCDASCTVDIWFIAEPTDASSSYASYAWQMDITAGDSGSNADTGSSSEELLSGTYFLIDDSISYGTVNPAATSTDQTLNATNTCNSSVNIDLSGVDMEDGASHTIAVEQQKYALSSLGDWVGTVLTITATELDVALSHPTATTSASVDDVYWMIKIPDPQYPGSYRGTNTADVVYEGA